MIGRYIELNHSHIGFLAVQSSTTSKLRIEGYRQALQETRRKLHEHYIVEGSDFSEDSGYALMKVLLGRSKLPTVVIACNDVMAVGAKRAIKEEGLSISENIAIVGYDDVVFARFLQVPLTTVHIPKYELGKEAMKLLKKKIEGEIQEPQYRRILRK